MPAEIASAFIVIQTQLFLLLLVVLFHPPSDFGQADQSPQAGLGGKIGKPEFNGLGILGGPFYQQPLARGRLLVAGVSMSRVYAQSRETGNQRFFGALPPADSFILPRSPSRSSEKVS
jgi:hypothetical protein